MKLYRKLITATCFALASLAVFAQGVVNINTATEQELVLLKGVGKSKAAEIVANREKEGAFKSVDDLTRVKGISTNIVEKNRDSLTLSGETTKKAVDKPKKTEKAPSQKKKAKVDKPRKTEKNSSQEKKAKSAPPVTKTSDEIKQ